MNGKAEKRLRRARRIHRRIARLQTERLCVHRTPRHIYAQIIDKTGARVLASASTLEPEVRKEIKHGGNVAAAQLIGKRIAEKAQGTGIARVAFDPNNPYEAIWAPAWRMVADPSDPDRSGWQTFTGQSGHAWSAHYDDLQSRWLAGKLQPMAGEGPWETLRLSPNGA